MHNLSEMCFNHVFKKKSLQAESLQSKTVGRNDLSKKQSLLVDECVQKYMESLKIVQRVTAQEIH